MNNAELIFKEIIEQGMLRIEKFVEEKQEEGLFLDFKEKRDPERGLSNDDKQNYAKAISAFSNSAGGVIVWGVKASKNGEEADTARELRPIKNIKRFLTDLNSLTNSAVIPINNGVENRIVFKDETSDIGFVITFVPESTLTPHRAMSKLNQYYTRAGDSFVMMEHYHLEDAFGIRQKPELELEYKLEIGARQGQATTPISARVNVFVGIKNNGRYVAKYPGLRIKAKSKLTSVVRTTPLSINKINHIHNVEGELYAGGLNDVIYPGMSLSIKNFTIEGFNAQIQDYIKIEDFMRLDNINDYASFEYEIFCEGCQSKRGIIDISTDEIKQVLNT